ncbi:MAG: Thymidylate synthase ThyX [Alphaproteobacteria bacterium MarineAlpha3_Bin7]|nr:MAG: Thymidylate synthase ThyX [Alphaproteobacteria bacterium MarineAlpha3_Bin7]
MQLTDEQKKEIDQARLSNFETRRPTVSELEEIMFKPLPVLDHGFVRIIDYMGDDAAIVQAARVSYGKGTTKVSDDAGLLNYLLRHRHSTPFEMCEIKYHIKLPIFIARQWIRHRTANVNEYSARYSVLDREFYIPDQVNLATQSKSNRQGRGEVLEGKEAAAVLDLLRDDAENNYNHYVEMLNEDESGHIIDETRDGLSRELARMNLTLNTYTQWYWKIDLHNLLHFLSLRADEHAQYEIRVYAEAIMETVKRWCPITYDAFIDHRINSVTLSGKAIQVIKKMIDGVSIDQEESGLSKREWRELMGVLEKLD